MATVFLFFDPINMTQTDKFWAVRLDDACEVDIPLAAYVPDEIKKLSIGARTVVVLPTSVASLHRLELPKLSTRKAREAIPYALEEELAEPVADLHVAFTRNTHEDQYLIVVMNRLRLRAWMNELEALGLGFDEITLDWFAVCPDEVCATATDLLVNQEAVIGALSPLLAIQYLNAHPKPASGFTFDDSESSLQELDISAHGGSYRLFVAKRLLAGNYINVCQGSFQRSTSSKGGARWYGLCALLLSVWFVSVLGINAVILHQLHVKQNVLDERIAKHYHVFFPAAKQVISPRFRIERLLGEVNTTAHDSFWTLFDAFATVLTSCPLEIEQIRFRDQILWVNVVARDFALLEEFQQKIKKEHINVKQTQASTRNNQVISTLELSL